MNDIQQIVDNFLRAAERLERLTVDINVMADQLEPTLRGVGQVKAVEWQPTPPETMERMRQARDQAVASIAAEAQVPPYAMAQDTPPGVIAAADGSLLNYQGENYVPQTPQGASPSSAPPMAAPPASAVEVEGPGAGTPETPRPAGPTSEAAPWNESAPGSAPGQPEKKSGRRTNEELAAEIGVRLEDVKKWKGGGRISKNDMEEFRRLFPQAVVAPHDRAVPMQPTSPFGGPAEPMPVTPQAPPVPQAAPAVPPANEWPVAQPVDAAPPATPGEQFEDWQTAASPWGADGDPFGG